MFAGFHKFSHKMSNLVVTVLNQSSRTYSRRKTISDMYRAQFLPQFPDAPYNFVCQIGDPVLRRKCDLVDETIISSPGFQDLISLMWKVHRDYECAGLSAPQIGLPLQIAVVGVDTDDIKGKRSALVTSVPRRVLINPVIKVMDYKSKITAPEVCASICSFSAAVARYTNIRVEALNERGERLTWDASGYEARIIQHEVDHLEGIVYVDKMQPRTLECTAWQQINSSKGRSSISYGPRKRSLLERFQLY